MGEQLYRYLVKQLQMALDGEMPPRWPSQESNEMAHALKSVFSEDLSGPARDRLLLRLGLAAVSALLERQRAGVIASRACRLAGQRAAPGSASDEDGTR